MRKFRMGEDGSTAGDERMGTTRSKEQREFSVVSLPRAESKTKNTPPPSSVGPHLVITLSVHMSL